MGKGDKKSKRGKIIIGSYGVRRPRKKKSTSPLLVSAPKEKEVKKTPEIVETVVDEPVKIMPEPTIQPSQKEGTTEPEKVEKPVPKKTAKKAVKEKTPAKKVAKKPKPAAGKTKKSQPEKAAEA